MNKMQLAIDVKVRPPVFEVCKEPVYFITFTNNLHAIQELNFYERFNHLLWSRPVRNENM